MTTYVFDFYNLYIPEGHEYENSDAGIRIEPLALAEDFEEHRREEGSKFNTGDWPTAKAYITSDDEDEAQQTAELLTFLYSFAQTRRAFWDTYYHYEEGYDGATTRPVLVPRIKNDKMPLVRGIQGYGFNVVDGFIDAALDRLQEVDSSTRSDILSTINLYLNSKARGLFAAKFLFAWIAIERTSEWNYHEYLEHTQNDFISPADREVIEDGISEILHDVLDEGTAGTLENRFSRDFLFEHRTRDKILIYLDHLEPEFDEQERYDLIRDANRIRNDIAHEFVEGQLMDDRNLTFQLQKILVFIIFDLLEISADLQQAMLLQLHENPEVSYPSGRSH